MYITARQYFSGSRVFLHMNKIIITSGVGATYLSLALPGYCANNRKKKRGIGLGRGTCGSMGYGEGGGEEEKEHTATGSRGLDGRER